MARREINIFGTSFLDLLSGALGAVIILFIIVPKMTRAEQDVLKKVQELEVVAGNIYDVLTKLENSVPKEYLEKIKTDLDQLKNHSETLQKELGELKEQVRNLQDENEELKRSIIEKDIELEELREKVSDTAKQLERAKQRNSAANTVEKTLGVFAKFGVLCRWEETDSDVDIGVQKYGSSPDQCWRMHPSKTWGILGEDVRERDFDENERFELFYVPKIVPDVYTVFAKVYDGSRGTNANIAATLIFHPGKEDESRYEIPSVPVSKQKNTWFVTFRLTDIGFEILPLREPIWGGGKVIK